MLRREAESAQSRWECKGYERSRDEPGDQRGFGEWRHLVKTEG